jgi:hypothetical protein
MHSVSMNPLHLRSGDDPGDTERPGSEAAEISEARPHRSAQP